MDTTEDLFSVKGKVAVVTGGTSGIGFMIARGLVLAGVRVYIVARTAEDCARVASELESKGECRAIPADLSRLDSIRQVAARFSEAEQRLDILVNSAGLLEQQPIEVYAEELWDRALDLNLKSAFFLSQQFLPLLRRAGTAEDPARIINIGSGHGLKVSPFDHFGYSASKAGLHHLTRALAQRLARDHINVNAIAPGPFKSRNTAGFSDQLVLKITSGVPRGRFGDEKDIVGTVIYLASRAGAYTTSIVLPVDGGGSGVS